MNNHLLDLHDVSVLYLIINNKEMIGNITHLQQTKLVC
jgi:hypothetical protein